MDREREAKIIMVGRKWETEGGGKGGERENRRMEL